MDITTFTERAHCWECFRPLIESDKIFTHEGRGHTHSFHLECIKKAADTFLNPKCPCCWMVIDTTNIFTWNDQIVMALRWMKQGAKVGSIFVISLGMVLKPTLEIKSIFLWGCNGAVNGGMIGAALKIEHFFLNYISKKLGIA